MPKIHILKPETARLIAAGEVIERPASALREILDNAIDAEAGEISVEIQKGGIDLVRVRDDGTGMSREDLALSILDHATSKIENPEDLLKARTLGFRGEALASIAAVARIDITTKDASSESGWRLTKAPGGEPRISPVAARMGTTVEAQAFFETYPARRQFLKRAVSEAFQCRTVFLEKALCHPGIRFLWQTGETKEHLEASDLSTRLALLYPELAPSRLEVHRWGVESGKATLAYADPSIHRRDRKFLQIFVNRRKVPEWGLAGIIDYAFSEYLPGGMHPVAFLFLEIDPKEVDFNIHPAKREVRIRRLEDLKTAILAEMRVLFKLKFGAGPTDLSGQLSSRDFSWPARPDAFSSHPSEAPFWERLIAEAPQEQYQAPQKMGFRYIGRASGPFILFEREASLYVLDQHAAHERILYDRMLESSPSSQPLLVPALVELESEDQEKRLAALMPELKRLGFKIERSGETFVVDEVPSFLGEQALPVLLDSLKETNPGDAPAKRLVATMACRAAVKDGDRLEDAAAKDLIEKALALPFPRCPHGRPIWAILDMETLYKMVGRIP